MTRPKSESLARLVQAARDRELFQRERVPLEVRLEAVLLYHRGLSLRKVAAHLGHQFCAESVRFWMRKVSVLFSYPIPEASEAVVVDETRLHRGRRTIGFTIRYRKHGSGRRRKRAVRLPVHDLPTHTLWVAVDAATLHVVNLKLARGPQTNNDCHEFLADTRLRSHCDPFVIHDRGPWYLTQTRRLNLDHATVQGGLRSLIECWNRQLKHRLDGFWRAWTPNTSDASLETWLRAYAVLWNFCLPTRP